MTTRDGCSVRTATSPAVALGRIRSDEETFDCVISDYIMPEMNGADGSNFTESKMVTALDDGRLLIAVSETNDGTGNRTSDRNCRVRRRRSTSSLRATSR